MSCRFVLLALALVGGACPVALAQTLPVPNSSPEGKAIPPNLKITPPTTENHPAAPSPAVTVNQEAMDRLTQSNRDLLDLLKKQQSVLEDIQYDRRLQSRRIDTLSERLEESLQDNAKLQAQVASLQATAAATAAGRSNPTPEPSASTNVVQQPAPPTPEPTAPPASYLPPAPEENGPPGTAAWHRLFTLSGTDSKTSDMFHVKGHNWRVVWHNQDREGKTFAGTSGLFINAFPKNDTIPQKVCSKVGSGGDSTDLQGPGNYYLKIEASGGSWELAVEDLE